MLEHIPHWLGAAMQGLRAGADKLAIAQPGLGEGFATIGLMSPAFADNAVLPVRFTADGAGISPPLLWDEVPAGTTSLALIVEDADSPTPSPLVHAIVWGLSADTGRLAEGAIGGGDEETGRNSFFAQGWLPPDPPTGHGEHHYVFQLFALAAGAGDPGEQPGRGAVIEAMAGQVLGAGLLTGIYSRGEPEAAAMGSTALGTA